MDKLKLLNLFILAFLVSLMIQLVFFPPEKTIPVSAGIILEIEDDSLVMPNIPRISIHNPTGETVDVSPCQDISINITPIGKISWLEKDIPNFCDTLSVQPWEKKNIPMELLYKLFSTQSGKYIVTLSYMWGESMVFFDVEKPGAIRKFVSATIYQPIYNLFVALLTWIPWHPLWWAIIIVTLIIRLILLVPQHHMLEWQKKLQKLQPKIKALQKQYKWDQATLGMKMLELYKSEKVNPMASIVPLLIQMPILIWLYWVISEINEPSNFYHLYSIFAGFDPTEIVTLFYGLELGQVGGIVWLIFSVCLWLVQYIQAKLSFSYNDQKDIQPKETALEKKEKDDDAPEFALDPQMMQKMMLYFFPLVIGITAYFFPLGVGLYWFIGTIFVIGQQAYVNRKH